ncbi:MAG TPA: alpha/beta hydrolase [Gemmatimonadaceae bacterium]|nr:alpha/beta hydrolase [Gemmatimonadaceae bacterium]
MYSTTKFARSAMLVAALSVIGTRADAQSSAWGGNTAATGKYAKVNGVNIYYEVHGTGKPLVLLHGGLGTGTMFGPNVAALAKGRQVILPDLQGHGRTADIDRPIRHDLIADDIAALIKHLGLSKADVVGYSLGGGVALQVAIRHPEVVDRLVVASVPFKRTGFYAEMLQQQAAVGAAMADQMKGTPMYELYQAIAPRKQDFPRLLDKVGAMMREDYDYSAGVRKITAKTLLVFADADMISTSHVAEFFGLFGGGLRDAGWDGSTRPKAQLAIVPNQTHYSLFAVPAFAEIVMGFLDAK